LNTFMQKQSIHEPQTYYVDSLDGDDTHEWKSFDTPWKTITKINILQYENINFFWWGDKVLLKNGSFFQNEFYIQSSGTINNPITVSNYWDDRLAIPTITGWKCLTHNVHDIKMIIEKHSNLYEMDYIL
jgi:hypothetical protein